MKPTKEKIPDIKFKTFKDFQEYYFPKHCDKYPIEMRLTKEEADFIKRRRGRG